MYVCMYTLYMYVYAYAYTNMLYMHMYTGVLMCKHDANTCNMLYMSDIIVCIHVHVYSVHIHTCRTCTCVMHILSDVCACMCNTAVPSI